MKNETLRLYKSLKSARKARIAYTALHKRKCSEIFKHDVKDKRIKCKERYAFIVDVQLIAA